MTIEWAVLQGFFKKPALNYLNDPLSLIEFNKSITKIILHKAHGLNGASPNELFLICSDFLDNDVEIEDWKVGNIKILQKKKKTLQIQITGEVLIYLM